MRGQTVTEEAASIEEAEALAWPRATWAEGEELRKPSGRYFGSGKWRHPTKAAQVCRIHLLVPPNDIFHRISYKQDMSRVA